MMASPNRATELHAWLDGRHVGVFRRQRRGVTFEYEPEYRGLPLSISFTPNRLASRAAPARYLDGLLPTNDSVRAGWALRANCAPDPLSLLTHVGEDVAGAVVLLPPGETPDTVREFIPVTEQHIVERACSARSLDGTWPPTQARLSLAGAQTKFALTRTSAGWVEPFRAAPSTHIFKPDTPRYAGIARLEASVLDTARLIGVDSAFADVWDMGTFDTLVVERFDRRMLDGELVRLHAEDLCQASGRDSSRKYAQEGGPTARTVLTLLGRHGGIQQQLAFIEQLAINVTVGNADAHAKNVSILIHNDGVALSAMYDTVPTIVWPQLASELAMPVASAQHARAVTPDHWRKLARSAGVDESAVAERAIETIRRIPDAINHTMAEYAIPDAIRGVVLGHVNAVVAKH